VKKTRLLAGFAGAAALGLLVYRIGFSDIAAQARNLGRVLPLILLAGAIRLWAQTRAWRTALCAEGIHVPQSRLAGVRLASQAASYLAVLGPAVSEPAKLILLRNSAGMSAVAAPTLVESGMYWFVTAILGLAGMCAAALLVSNPGLVWASAGIFGVALAALATRHSILTYLVRWAGARAPRWLRSAERVELRIRSFRDRQPQAARKVLALAALAQFFTLVEVSAVLWAIGLQVSVLHVVAIEAAGRMVKILGAWVPGRIGADEGGAAASFALLGLPPVGGLLLVVTRRVRDLLWCTAGIGWAARLSAWSPTGEARTSPASPFIEEC